MGHFLCSISALLRSNRINNCICYTCVEIQNYTVSRDKPSSMELCPSWGHLFMRSQSKKD